MSNHVKFSEDQETFRTNLSSELIVRTEGSPVRQHRVRLSRIKDPRHKLLQVNQSVDINLIYKDLLKEKMNKNKIVGNIKSKRLRQISPGRFYHRPESKSSPIRNENDTSLSITTLKSKNNKQENSSDDKLQEKLVLNKSKNSSIVYAGIYSPETNRPSSAGDFPLIAVSSIIESGFN